MSSSGKEQSPKDLLASVGGPIGILESLVPGTVYVTVFSLTFNVFLAAVISGTIALGFAIYQIIKKRPLTQVVAGVVGLGLSIYLPLRDGLNNTHAADYFVPGLLTNVAYALAFGISLVVRFPLAGIVLGLLNSDLKKWRADRDVYRRYFWVSAMWLIMFLLRLAVEVPLYLTGQVPALGLAKLLLGTPLYALTIWFSWLVARVTLTKAK